MAEGDNDLEAAGIGSFDTALYFFSHCAEHETIKPYALQYQPNNDLP